MIYAEDIDTAYDKYKKYIVENGDLRVDERGDTLYQIPYMNITFHNQSKVIGGVELIPIPKEANFSYEALRSYYSQLLNPYKGGFVYTYGNRLRSYFNVDQLETMVNHIKSNAYTRRAFASTIDPLIDNMREDVPCLQHVQIAVYNNQLLMYVLFRSNDIKYAFIDNMYGLQCLHLDLAHETGYRVGDFIYTCYNPHWKIK